MEAPVVAVPFPQAPLQFKLNEPRGQFIPAEAQSQAYLVQVVQVVIGLPPIVKLQGPLGAFKPVQQALAVFVPPVQLVKEQTYLLGQLELESTDAKH